MQGNYRRVIFEGQAQTEGFSLSNTDELDYLLALSYLKENNLSAAQNCFKRVLSNSHSKFKALADLGLADSYLIGGNFLEAQHIYEQLIVDNPNSNLKGMIWYRLSQLALRRGNTQESNEYLFKLRRDFPLSTELRLTKSLPKSNILSPEPGELSLQLGFFASQQNALNFKDKLLAQGYPAYVLPTIQGCRVRVGKFKTLAEAQEIENKLSAAGYPAKLCE